MGGAAAGSLNPLALLLAVLGMVLAYAIARSGILTGIRIGLARRSLEKALRRAQEAREPSTVVELYAAMLRLLALLERAKLPSETHREYHETLRGIAREIHGRAMRIYEKAKFAGEPPSPGELSEMRSLAERLAAIASRAARLGRGARA